MIRRTSIFTVTATTCAVVSLACSAVASAQGPTSGFAIGHDDSLAPGDVQSDFFALAGSDVTLSPEAQREAIVTFLEAHDTDNSFTPPTDPDPTDDAGWGWERRRIVIPEGDVNGSFTVTVRWADPSIDFDLYIYRQRPNGTIDGNPIATSAQGGTTEESATVVANRVDQPVAAGTYWAYVDNWCSAQGDPLDLELEQDVDDFCAPDPSTAGDEDDWLGSVTFAPLVLQNKKPVVGLVGPASTVTGRTVSYTANATDPDGTIRDYAFDLDGDGRFEYDNGASNVVTTDFETAGVRNVGVRVIDDRGGVTVASMRVEVTGAPQSGPPKPVPGVVKAFRLNRPVFGGRRNAPLRVRYRLREESKVTISLHRDGERVRRLANQRTREAGRLYRFTVRSKNLRRGLYTIRLRVVGVSGRAQTVKLRAQRL